MLFPNLRAEMARTGRTQADIAYSINRNIRTVREKMNGNYPFTLQEAYRIRGDFFPDLSIDYLFALQDETKQAPAP